MIGIIVDGRGDYACIKARLRTGVRVLKTDGPRGHLVAPAQLASSAGKQVKILSSLGCQRVVILADYEERDIPYEEFVAALKAEIDGKSYPVDVCICIPNRMIENWFLADTEELARRRAYIKKSARQKKYEGTHGKTELKKIFVKGVSYNEVKHGPQLFATVRLDIARRNSSSFASFLDILGSVCE